MRALLFTIVLLSALAPAYASVDTADACQPLWWMCPLNGQYYAICGTSPPPIVTCAQDTIRDAHLPTLP